MEDFLEVKEEIQKLISKDSTEKAIDRIIKFIKNSKIDNNLLSEVLLISNNFNEYKKRNRQGLINYQQRLEIKNYIISRFLETLEEVGSSLTKYKNSNLEFALKRNLELKRRIENDFSLWLDFKNKDRTRNSMMVIRAHDASEYPHYSQKNKFGKYSWFQAEIHRLYFQGIEYIYGIEGLFVLEDGSWEFESDIKPKEKYRIVTVAKIGQINFSDIIDYDINGDEHYLSPHIFCKFRHEGSPFENTYFQNVDKNYEYFHFK